MALDVNQIVQQMFSDPATFKQVMQAMTGKGKLPDQFKLSAEQEKETWAAIGEALNTPIGRQYAQDRIRDMQTERFVKRNKPFFDAMLAGADLATSISQIRQSNKAIRELKKPTMPSPNVLDPALNRRIAQAQTATLDASRATEPAAAMIGQQRTMDVNTARQISGGQAGAYGAGVTGASLRAMRESAKLPIIRDQIKARQEGRVDQLLTQRQNVLQQEFNNRMAVARENMDQYQLDAAAAAALGQAGRQNLRLTLGQMPELITRTASNMLPVQDVWDAYGSQVQKNIADSFQRPRVDMPSLSPIYPGMSRYNNIESNINQNQAGRMSSLRRYTRPTYSYNTPLVNTYGG